MGKNKDKKKKKEGILKKTDSEIKSIVSLIVHGEEDYGEKKTMMGGLIDEEEYVDVDRLAGVIGNRIRRGESAAEIAYYRHDVLTKVCAHVHIEGRAKMTRKKEMAVALVKHFGGKKKQWKDID